MKVGILTWFQAINHGAVLQTYGSSEIIKSMGAKPVILNYEWSLYDNENKKARLIRRLKKFSPSKLIWFLQVKKLFNKKADNFRSFIKKNLNIGNEYDKEFGLDAVYIGSDMVFDISEGYNPYMHGESVPAPYKFSYAASFGYSTIEMIRNSGHYEDIKRNLNNLVSIGYRDQKTREICEELGVAVPLTETIDPVLCYGFEKEIDAWDKGKWKRRNYLLVYAYDSTMNDKETINTIKEFAKEKDLEMISCGYYHNWCDECVPAAPDEFLEMFKHSQYIITDTFHGTVFSLILHKCFASIIRENGFKLRYLLECTKLENRIADEPFRIREILSSDPDFSYFDSWVAIEREHSRSFIQENLNRAQGIEL